MERFQLCQLIVDSSLSCPPPPTAIADDLFQTYDDTLRGIADQVAPERTVRCRLRPLSSWFDDKCRAIHRNYRHLERRYRRTRDLADKTAYSAPAATNTASSTKERRTTGQSASRLTAVHRRNSGGRCHRCYSERSEQLTTSHLCATTLTLLYGFSTSK